MKNIPTATAIPDTIPDSVPQIPELGGRTATHNEAYLISGGSVAAASSNVKEFWWKWDEQKLFVRFLDEALYAYSGVPLAVAVGMIETDSPGRYVWNVLRDRYPTHRVSGSVGKRARSQVVRLINKP